MLVKKRLTERFSGWAALTASRSHLRNEETGASFPIFYDQPFVMSLVFSAKLPWQAFADFKYHYHRLSKKFQFDTWQLESYLEVINVFDKKNIYRYDFSPPDYTSAVPNYQVPRLIAFGARFIF